MADRIEWDEKSLAELKALAAALHEQLARNPQHSRVELQDLEWEIEKRGWLSADS